MSTDGRDHFLVLLWKIMVLFRVFSIKKVYGILYCILVSDKTVLYFRLSNIAF